MVFTSKVLIGRKSKISYNKLMIFFTKLFMGASLEKIAKLIRYYILISTTEAGSGHVTSSFSATDLMTTLMFGGFFKSNLENPTYINNDRLIFSKGHAAPLLYALYAAAGKVGIEELKTLRKFGSPLEGHPTMHFPYTEAATGSLGQGLSVGVGMALNAKKFDHVPHKTYVLLGDSEMAEGSVWEAMELAAYYQLNNLIGIIDVNRLGQRGETMHGWNTKAYENKVKAFGWNSVVIDGHDYGQIKKAFERAQASDKPFMVIAKTIKGKGVSFLENKEGWHGKALSKTECEKALEEMGNIDLKIKGKVEKPKEVKKSKSQISISKLQGNDSALKIGEYRKDELVSTRKAYGNALIKLGSKHADVVVLDAETSNSTYAELFKKEYPERFLEMFIAEQNMVGTALGLSKRGKKPFVSTFGVFFTRSFDQIRMSAYSHGNIAFVGSHAGVSIGEDGTSQMALEDISLFRSIFGSVVLYPSDAISAEKLTELCYLQSGISYLRTSRSDMPVLYSPKDSFKVGGSQVLRKTNIDQITIVAAGVTVHESLKAYDILKKEGISIRVIDLYSVKPVDVKTLQKSAKETKALVVVEDHYVEGGIYEAVVGAIGHVSVPIISLAVTKMPRSGKKQELLDYEKISAKAIVAQVHKLI